MKFCPDCEVRLKKDHSTSSLSCPKCGYSETGSQETKKETKEEKMRLLKKIDIIKI